LTGKKEKERKKKLERKEGKERGSKALAISPKLISARLPHSLEGEIGEEKKSHRLYLLAKNAYQGDREEERKGGVVCLQYAGKATPSHWEGRKE